jgi:hypothetical protein
MPDQDAAAAAAATDGDGADGGGGRGGAARPDDDDCHNLNDHDGAKANLSSGLYFLTPHN